MIINNSSNKPLIIYDNVLRESSVTASSANTQFPITNVQNPSTYPIWRAANTDGVFIDMSLPEEHGYTDHLAIARHNLGNFSRKVQVFGAAGNTTNEIRNSTMAGASAGVVGSGGSLPNGWSIVNSGGVEIEVIGTGKEDVIDYIDLRFNGLTSPTSEPEISFIDADVANAEAGEIWTGTVYHRLVGGTLNNVDAVALTLFERDSGGSSIGLSSVESVQTSDEPLWIQRIENTDEVIEANTAFINSQLSIKKTGSVEIDLTLRLGLPQLEKRDSASLPVRTTNAANTGPAFEEIIQPANRINNNTMQGALVGVPGDGADESALPDFWRFGGGNLQFEIVQKGREDGIDYVDFNVAGTPTGTTCNIYFGPLYNDNFNVAEAGETWTASAYVTLAGGDMTNISVAQLALRGRDNVNNSLRESGNEDFTPTSGKLKNNRKAVTHTLTDSDVNRVATDLRLATTAGQPIDITLRIGLPMLEKASSASERVRTFGYPYWILDNEPVIFSFDSARYTNLRLWIHDVEENVSDSAQIGVMYAGKALRLPRNIYVGHSPGELNRVSTVVNNRSESGEFLGRIVQNQSTETSVDMQNIPPVYYRQKIDPFAAKAVEQPFYFAWRPADYPNEVQFGWMTGDAQTSNQLPNGFMSFSFSMRGVK